MSEILSEEERLQQIKTEQELEEIVGEIYKIVFKNYKSEDLDYNEKLVKIYNNACSHKTIWDRLVDDETSKTNYHDKSSGIKYWEELKEKTEGPEGREEITTWKLQFDENNAPYYYNVDENQAYFLGSAQLKIEKEKDDFFILFDETEQGKIIEGYIPKPDIIDVSCRQLDSSSVRILTNYIYYYYFKTNPPGNIDVITILKQILGKVKSETHEDTIIGARNPTRKYRAKKTPKTKRARSMRRGSKRPRQTKKRFHRKKI